MSGVVNGRFLVVVAFVIERDHHVLLLRRSMSKDHAPGEWEPGSGRVRQGEAPLAALLREVKEETGLDVTVLGPLDTFHFYRGTAREEAIGITSPRLLRLDATGFRGVAGSGQSGGGTLGLTSTREVDRRLEPVLSGPGAEPEDVPGLTQTISATQALAQPRAGNEREAGQNACGLSGDESGMTPRPGGPLDANSLKRQSSIVLPALASNKHTRRAGAGALRELRDTISGLLRQPDETLCAECVATVLGRPVGGVLMTILGLHGRLTSLHGVCSTCHRYTRVVRREA
jgi:ADP-ribose pyrophosphatase YjhB (NUDIX family)